MRPSFSATTGSVAGGQRATSIKTRIETTAVRYISNQKTTTNPTYYFIEHKKTTKMFEELYSNIYEEIELSRREIFDLLDDF